MRRKRYYQSKKPYALTFRTKQGLPFACYDVIELLLKSTLARTQRDDKLDLCHQLWMANHVHLLAVFYDINQAKNFHMEVKKKITDYLKRLLDLEELDLWEEDDSVILLADIEAVKNYIVYIYLNPSRANLVESVDNYPQLNSWSKFKELEPGIESSNTEKVPWIRLPAIKAISSKTLTRTQDRHITNKLKNNAKKEHKLTLKPYAWLKCFKIDSNEAERIKTELIKRVYVEESELAEKRVSKKNSVIGVKRLKLQGIKMTHYKPKKKGRRIFVISTVNEVRMKVIAQFKAIFQECRELYQRLKTGEKVIWPPGVFPPTHPPLLSFVTF